MRRYEYLALFGLGLIVALIAARWVQAPGYMDAEYYYAGSLQLYNGAGLSQPFLWNYLDDPQGLPHPSHTYWMPLASLLGLVGMWLRGSSEFAATQTGFVLLAGCLPPLAAFFALRLTGQARIARLAGLLATVPGFYLPYLVTVESFGLYMVFGGLILLLSFVQGESWQNKSWLHFGLLGVLAGSMHLARADGLLWLLGCLGLAVWHGWSRRKQSTHAWKIALGLALSVAEGYGVITGWWYARNLQLFGTLMPPGGSRTLWLMNYDQIFTYPAEQLNPQAWLEAGLSAALRARLDALWQNLKTLVGVQFGVVLLPLVVAGVWVLRRDSRVQFGVLMSSATLAFMSFVFPFAGARGGFFHSGAALQMLVWAIAATGFDAFIRAGVRLRNWNEGRAWKMFAPALVVIMLILTAVLYMQRVIGSDPSALVWSESQAQARAVNARLDALGAAEHAVVMLNNPVGLFAASARSAIVIPDGELQTILRVVKRYRADFLVLEENHVRGLDALYLNPQSVNGLEYLGSWEGAQFYEIK